MDVERRFQVSKGKWRNSMSVTKKAAHARRTIRANKRGAKARAMRDAMKGLERKVGRGSRCTKVSTKPR